MRNKLVALFKLSKYSPKNHPELHFASYTIEFHYHYYIIDWGFLTALKSTQL